jgi:hypothetical protein
MKQRHTVECEEYILTLIDTPALSDIEGYEKDEEIKKSIITRM